MKKLLIYIFCMSFFLNACDVINQEPMDSVSNEVLFETPSDAEAAIIGVYRQLADLGLNYIVFPELPTKNTVGTSLNRQYEQMNNLLFLDDNPYYETLWNQHYILINRANVVIQRVPGIPGLEEQKRNEVVAEAKFLRAFAYFSLVRYFGEVPLITNFTTTPDVGTLQVSRNAVEEVYIQVFEDLDYAKENLPISFASTLESKARATRDAAYALGSRIYLFRKEYAKVISDADMVIASKGEELTISYSSLFENKNSDESILEINYDSQLTNSLATNFLPGSLGGNWVIEVNSNILEAYEDGDVRKDATFGIANDKYYMKKYSSGSSKDDNVILLRLAEVLLNKSEAMAELSGLNTESVELLNEVRSRAGLVPTQPVSLEDFRIALYNDRRLELSYEGHEWFDLVRTERLSSFMGITDPTKAIFPIPAGEILRNPNLKPQNPGY